MWGDHTFLIDKNDLKINLVRMMNVFAFSCLQIFVSVALEPVILGWAFLGLTALFNIFIYEAFVKDFSWDE